MAYDAAIWNLQGTGAAETPIVLGPGESKTLSYHVENILPDNVGKDLTYSYTVQPSNSLGNEGDISIVFSSPSFTPSSTTDTDIGVITITNTAGIEGASYLVSVSAGAYGVEFGAASRHVSSIPEFPTVALPVAGILGLLFIFGRKKEEM
ncbi:MAG: PEF-CTERM sorting domain-containing protein [Methanosarcina mazei]